MWITILLLLLLLSVVLIITAVNPHTSVTDALIVNGQPNWVIFYRMWGLLISTTLSCSHKLQKEAIPRRKKSVFGVRLKIQSHSQTNRHSCSWSFQPRWARMGFWHLCRALVWFGEFSRFETAADLFLLQLKLQPRLSAVHLRPPLTLTHRRTHGRYKAPSGASSYPCVWSLEPRVQARLRDVRDPRNLQVNL